jgi:hypothetical protein
MSIRTRLAGIPVLLLMLCLTGCGGYGAPATTPAAETASAAASATSTTTTAAPATTSTRVTTAPAVTPTAQADSSELDPTRIEQIKQQFLRRGFTNPIVIVESYDEEAMTVRVEAGAQLCTKTFVYRLDTAQVGLPGFSEDTSLVEFVADRRWAECLPAGS